ncbi:hypothetical protein PMAYCL1PPCAC_12052, partial [Pristionchus mayeri]
LVVRRIDWSSEGFGSHGTIPVARPSESCSCVHGESTRSQSEPYSLRPELPSMALLAVQLVLVGSTCDRVKHLVAHTALEAHLVPLVSACAHF